MKSPLKMTMLGAAMVPFLAAGATAQSAMKGDQIKAAVSGKSFDFAGAYNGVMDFSAGGAASLTLKIGVKKSGTWQVKGNEFCSTWQGEPEKCGTWTKQADGTIKTSNGFTMTPK